MVTPGFSVAGVLMILSGAVYALIGMKNKMIHIFLSSAYLASLGVAVLIVYVMSPPVSNAIQGAYVVAIVMTGLILGGASLLFTEMTEGLGCLFGGFSLSMWLLVLRPGGLLQSTGAVSGFIAAITVAVYATSFSHYTRPYGLIGSVSFGGATVVVMGIDCFSRAGLKEFWAYIWNLNENLFPLGATTYPMTKGIRVEIAAIIIIFLAGVISQSRLWNIIKSQREKRALQRLEDERHIQEEEANVGKRIEVENQRARAEWEGVYGDKDAAGMASADSGIGMESPRKGARSTMTSTRHSGDDEIEMAQMPAADMTGAGLAMAKDADGVLTVRVVADDEPIPELGPDGKPLSVERRLSQKSQRASGEGIWVIGADGEARPASSASRRNSKRDSKRKSTGPEVTPLPFTVPEDNAEGDVEDDRSSVATFATDGMKRGSLLLRSLSKRSQVNNPSRLSKVSMMSTSEEKLVVEDDRSSVAATMDGLSDDEGAGSLPDFSPPPSRAGIKDDTEEPSTKLAPKATLESGADAGSASKDADGPAQESLAASTDLKSASPSATPSEGAAPSVKSTPSAPAALTKSALPTSVSKVVMSYRTNEWAKHLSSAESPEPEALNLKTYASGAVARSSSMSTKNVKDSTKVESSSPVMEVLQKDEQAAAPVDIVELQKTAQDGQVAPAPPVRSVSSMSKRGGPPSAHINPLRMYRNSSTPAIGATLVESPIEEDLSPQSQVPATSFAQAAGNTLLGKRDTMLRSKSSTFTPMASTPELQSMSQYPTPGMSRSASAASFHPPYSASPSPYGTSPMGSNVHIPGQLADPRLEDDNLSLSARKSIMRQSSSPGTSIRGVASSYGIVGANGAFDSHQPQRDRMSNISPPATREAQLASWRASVAADLGGSNTQTPLGFSTPQAGAQVERQLSMLGEEKRKAEWMAQMQEKERREKERIWDERMRSGVMVDAHREALRKMQREANKHAR